jgi:hypothetical protein
LNEIITNPGSAIEFYDKNWGEGGYMSRYKDLSYNDLVDIIMQNIQAQVFPVLRKAGLTDRMAMMRIIASDNIWDVMKRGASALWDVKDAIFPEVGPLIDRGIGLAKGIISTITGSGDTKVMDAVRSDHTNATTQAVGTLSNLVNRVTTGTMPSSSVPS